MGRLSTISKARRFCIGRSRELYETFEGQTQVKVKLKKAAASQQFKCASVIMGLKRMFLSAADSRALQPIA